MPVSVFGLPVHPLVVHATVVFVPLAAVFVLASALWPAFRRWAGPLPLASDWPSCRRWPGRTVAGWRSRAPRARVPGSRCAFRSVRICRPVLMGGVRLPLSVVPGWEPMLVPPGAAAAGAARDDGRSRRG